MAEWDCRNVPVSSDLYSCFVIRDLCSKTRGGLDTVVYKKYIFGLHSHFWSRAPRTIGIL